jgi:hypothetical protein
MTAQRAISLCSLPGYEGGRGFKHVQKRRHNSDYDASICRKYEIGRFLRHRLCPDLTETVLATGSKIERTLPGETRLATLHLSMSDATGDSAIVEYIDGKQVIHHGRKYQVMTNSPIFDEQLALNEYWKQIGGTVMLPGTNRAADRFARASFYVNAIPKDEDPIIALDSVFSVIRNVSVPFGITTPNKPNISSTRWRTVADHKRKLYFFESALTPNTFWVDLKQVDFSSQTGKVKKLDLGKDQRSVFSGNAVKDFKEAEPFKFQGLSRSMIQSVVSINAYREVRALRAPRAASVICKNYLYPK